MKDAQITRMNEHVIVALDVPDMQQALALVDQLGGVVSKFKVGSRLFTRHGPAFVEALAARGAQIFLDLKFHDIPNTVADAVGSALTLDAVFMLTIHAAGGREMIRRAAEAARGRPNPPKIVAVTALTSLALKDVRDLGVDLSPGDWAERLGALAIQAGADGLVCSPLEVAQLRARFPDALLVTPGIRPAAASAQAQSTRADDQQRILTPREALQLGSDLLVIGRPIYQAADPAQAALTIAQSL